MVHRVERVLGSNVLSLETGKLAKQAHGAVLVGYGDTVVLVAAVEGEADLGRDFFPLTVDYRERTYAAGKFPGGFIKREGRPSNKEILTARLCDRPIRPLFPTNYFNEVQIMATVLSSDRQHDSDILAMIGASAALHISHIPFSGPTGSIRVARIDGQLVPMPSFQQLEESELDLVISGTKTAVTMIEGFSRELPEDLMGDAILFAHQQCGIVVELINELREKCGLPAKTFAEVPVNPLHAIFKDRFYKDLFEAKNTAGKQDRAEKVATVREKITKEFLPEDREPQYPPAQVFSAFHWLEERVVRESILQGRRIDGRKTDQLRALSCEVGVLPRTHGSAIFQRGETQALVITTLGTPADEQRIDGLQDEYSKKFMLDYNFPPFSVGECRPIRGPGRREIGHGALAERSVNPIIPDPDTFPYTIRVVSEITESNGSSSMASVCGATLSLMDAGVPLVQPVAGVSIGLVKEGEQYALLTDIMGDEDHFGDMDFKVAGTGYGVTGIQLDLKIDGISEKIVRETLEQARTARNEILRVMLQTIPRPRTEISRLAPRLLTIQINPEKIGALIGPGGKNIKAIQESTGAKIDIQDDGTVTIACDDAARAKEARLRVEAITEEVRVGKVYEGKVISIKEFGAFVEILPGKDGLCHISELDDKYISRVDEVVKIGDRMQVKVIAIDDQDRVKLSRKAIIRDAKEAAGLLTPEEKAEGGTSGGGGGGGENSGRPERRERGEGDRGGRRGGDRGRGDGEGRRRR